MKINQIQSKQVISELQKKDNWNLVYFADLIIDDTKNATKIKTRDYLNTGKFPIIDQGQGLISGYTNDNQGLYKGSLPVIIFGDHTRIIKFVKEPFYLGADGVKLLISKKTIEMKYLYYFFKNITIPNTGYNRHYKYLKDLIIPLPPIETQKKIAKVLDKAQELIDKRKEQIEKLDVFIQSLFMDMFGDPTSNTKGWIVKALNELCTHIVDCPHSTPIHEEKPTEYPSIRTTELKNGRIYWSSMKYVGLAEYVKRTRSIKPQYGDIIYGREGIFGEAIIIPNNVTMCLGQRVMLFRPNNNLCNSIFLWSLVRSQYIYNQAVRKTSGSTVGHVNVKDIKKFTCILPPLKIQNNYAKVVEKAEQQKALLEKSLIEMENNFNSIMQGAFRGELF